MLFKHDYSFTNMLTPINVASDITDGSLVEIVLSCKSIFLFNLIARNHFH